MKNLNFNLRNLTGRFSTFLLIASAFLTSCQKDEFQPVAESTLQSEVQRAASVYSVLKIEHISLDTELPNYTVELLSNRQLHFEGIKNTNFIGEIKIEASQEQLDNIIELFKTSDFSSIEILSLPQDLPSVTTYFNTSRFGKTEIRFDDLEQPDQLVALRQAAEEILEIDQFVKE